MLQELLSVGDKIDIRKVENSSGIQPQKPMTYVSQLVNFAASDAIDITAPISKGSIWLLEAEESYQLCFYTKKGLYQCKCTLISRFKDNNIVICRVKLTSDLEKFQRRQYYRLECTGDIQYRAISQEEENLQDRLKNLEFDNPKEQSELQERLRQLKQIWNKAYLLDISGGGLRFSSDIAHAPEDKIQVKLEILVSGVSTKMELYASVISYEKLVNRSGAYAYRAEFYDISRKEREDLIKYIFEQERQRRQGNRG